MGDVVSIVIPCYNEEATIEHSLRAVLDQNTNDRFSIEVIVVLNGCVDQSGYICQRILKEVKTRRAALKVIEVKTASKSLALNIGDALAVGNIRVYMDADVVPAQNLIAQLYDVLSVEAARYGTGTLQEFSESWIVRAYGKAWRASPPIEGEVNGIGLYAVNFAGRRRWSSFPQIHSDDVFVRLQFKKSERIRVPAHYHWPLPSSWLDLVRVRIRWTEGNFEIKRRYPELAARWRKLDSQHTAYVLSALRTPVSFAVFSGTYLLCRLLARRHVDTKNEPWQRARRSSTLMEGASPSTGMTAQ